MESEYTTGFKLDRWQRLHDLEGSEADPSYQRIAALWEDYGPYQGRIEGRPPGQPSTIWLPHTKGKTPDKDLMPTGLEHAESECGGTDTGIRTRGSNTDFVETSRGWGSWRDARERAEPAVPPTGDGASGRRKGDQDSAQCATMTQFGVFHVNTTKYRRRRSGGGGTSSPAESKSF